MKFKVRKINHKKERMRRRTLKGEGRGVFEVYKKSLKGEVGV
jgi:hypothetical protein